MRTLKHLRLLFILSIMIVMSGCEMVDKWLGRDHEIGDIVIARKGLPMSGEQEVPARATPASGTIDVSYNMSKKRLTYKVTWFSLTSALQGSHIHGPAPRGANAGIVHDFTPMIPKAMSGTFTNTINIEEEGINEEDLLDGLYYINLHTLVYPGGEIRGQIEF